MSSKNVFVGIIIVLVGVIFLGINAGWWSADVWGSIWRLWPVLLIIAGLRQVVRNEPLFILLSLFTIAVGFILVGDVRWPINIGAANRTRSVETPSPGVSVSPEPTPSPATIREQLGEALGLTKPEDKTMNEFKSEINVGQLNALAIQLGRNYDITLTGADTDKVSVVLNGPENVLGDLSFAPDSSRLLLKDDGSTSGLTVFTDKEKVTGTITMPKALALDLNLSGVTKIKAQSLNGTLKVDNSGASSVELVSSTSQNLVADLSGTGKLILDQCTGSAEINLSGVGAITAQSCQLTNLKIDASGTGNIDIKAGAVTDLNAKASGVAKVKVPKPTGKLEANSDGASSISYY